MGYTKLNTRTIHWPSQANVQEGTPSSFPTTELTPVAAEKIGYDHLNSGVGSYLEGEGIQFENTPGKTFLVLQRRPVGEIIFLDPVVAAAVRVALTIDGEVPSSITIENVVNLKALTIVGATSLTGLEYFTSLERLIVHDSWISNIDPIINLKRLNFVSFRGNKVEVDLRHIPNIATINLEGIPNPPSNKITQLIASNCCVVWDDPVNVTPLAFTDSALESAVVDALDKASSPVYSSNILNLKSLNLQGKGISNITGLSACQQLENLNLAFNDVTDITELATLPIKYLNLTYNPNLTDVHDTLVLLPLVEVDLTRTGVDLNTISDIVLAGPAKVFILPVDKSYMISTRGACLSNKSSTITGFMAVGLYSNPQLNYTTQSGHTCIYFPSNDNDMSTVSSIKLYRGLTSDDVDENFLLEEFALPKDLTITNKTNTTPITLTCQNHGLETGDTIIILFSNPVNFSGVQTITKIDENSFSLNASTQQNDLGTVLLCARIIHLKTMYNSFDTFFVFFDHEGKQLARYNVTTKIKNEQPLLNSSGMPAEDENPISQSEASGTLNVTHLKLDYPFYAHEIDITLQCIVQHITECGLYKIEDGSLIRSLGTPVQGEVIGEDENHNSIYSYSLEQFLTPSEVDLLENVPCYIGIKSTQYPDGDICGSRAISQSQAIPIPGEVRAKIITTAEVQGFAVDDLIIKIPVSQAQQQIVGPFNSIFHASVVVSGTRYSNLIRVEFASDVKNMTPQDGDIKVAPFTLRTR